MIEEELEFMTSAVAMVNARLSRCLRCTVRYLRLASDLSDELYFRQYKENSRRVSAGEIKRMLPGYWEAWERSRLFYRWGTLADAA